LRKLINDLPYEILTYYFKPKKSLYIINLPIHGDCVVELYFDNFTSKLDYTSAEIE
jgi:hypothetical protein